MRREWTQSSDGRKTTKNEKPSQARLQSRDALRILARMIARAYLRDKRQGNSDSNVEETRISQTGLKNSEEVEGETRYNQEKQ